MEESTTLTAGTPLTLQEKEKLLEPIDSHIAGIQKQIDALRVDGVDKVYSLQEEIDQFKKNKELDDATKAELIQKDQEEILKAKEVVAQNKEQIKALIAEAETYLKEHYNAEYYSKIKADCALRKTALEQKYVKDKEDAKLYHQDEISKLQATSKPEELKDAIDGENTLYKNRLYDLKVAHENGLQALKDEVHNAFRHKYHLIDLLRKSHFTILQNAEQKAERYKYNFKLADFLLKNGLYLIMIAVFIAFCIISPIKTGIGLLSMKNILQILENSSTRIFFALGVAGLILLGGTDLSIGRMVGMSMTITAVFWHQGDNIISFFGLAPWNFDSWPLFVRLLLPLVISVILCGGFSALAGFFTAKFKMHPFISTMANQLIIFGLFFFATKGVNSGGVDSRLVNIVTPKIGGTFPTIIFWAIACIAVVWFIWNKTKIGKNMYAVGGNPEAAAVSGISVFWVTIFAFALAGILYGIGGFLECSRMRGSATAAYGSGWETDAIAACVVGGISFSGGIGKISGAVFGVIIFTALTYSLSFMGIDTNLQYVIKGVIILAAVALDSLKYMKKK